MKALNRAYLLGHVHGDPVLDESGSMPSLTLILSTASARKIGLELVDVPDLHTIVAVGVDADFLGRLARSGDVLAVECSLRSTWHDANGCMVTGVRLQVERILWLQSRRVVEAAPELSPMSTPNDPELF